MSKVTFGIYLKELRLSKGYGLRSFARRVGLQPSNLSLIESGRQRPPQNERTLRHIAEALDLMEDSKEWDRLFDLAAAPGEIPSDAKGYLDEIDAVQELPIMARAIKSQKLTKEQIRRLIEDLRRL